MRIDTVNASPPRDEPPLARTAKPPRVPAVAPAQLSLSLQLARASTMALTRLQLAIQSGDRHQTMAALDRLHTLDAEMERLVGHLPARPDDDAEWRAISRHVADQKLAIAFEKLALASEISGPAIVSRGASPLPPRAAGEAQPDAMAEPPPLRDWPLLPDVRPTLWQSLPAGVIGFILALVVTCGLVAAVVFMMPR